MDARLIPSASSVVTTSLLLLAFGHACLAAPATGPATRPATRPAVVLAAATDATLTVKPRARGGAFDVAAEAVLVDLVLTCTGERPIVLYRSRFDPDADFELDVQDMDGRPARPTLHGTAKAAERARREHSINTTWTTLNRGESYTHAIRLDRFFDMTRGGEYRTSVECHVLRLGRGGPDDILRVVSPPVVIRVLPERRRRE